MKTRMVLGGFLPGLLVLAQWSLSSAGPPNFDKLGGGDRKVFADRFEKEIWPLLSRNGKDGCLGCHGPGAKGV